MGYGRVTYSTEFELELSVAKGGAGSVLIVMAILILPSQGDGRRRCCGVGWALSPEE